MADWVVSLPADLPTSSSEDWDGAAAQSAIFSWAGGDDFDPDKAKRGFVFHDAAEPTLRASFKVPVARPIDGTLTVIKGGVRAAKSRGVQADVPADVRDRGIARLNGYWDTLTEGDQAGYPGGVMTPPLRLGTGPTGLATLTCAPTDALGNRSKFASTLLPGQPGLEGYLAPTFVLADRHLFFTEGAFKKTLRENLDHTHHLFNHWPDLILGKHVSAVEDEHGLRVVVQINEDVALGRDVMSNYRFGINYAWSIGFDTVRDRSGTAEDDTRLDRSGVPDAAHVPVTEFRAVTEAKMWESSTVTWGAIASAGPQVVQSRSAPMPAFDPAPLFAALRSGRLSPEHRRQLEAVVLAWQSGAPVPVDLPSADASRAAAGFDHGTRDHGSVDRSPDVAALLATQVGVRLWELANGPQGVARTG